LTNTVERVLQLGGSFNLYMLHGGTSFGFTAGANDEPYRPQPTSYDYGAPIDEGGGAMVGQWGQSRINDN
jgi:beta-galactosidase